MLITSRMGKPSDRIASNLSVKEFDLPRSVLAFSFVPSRLKFKMFIYSKTIDRNATSNHQLSSLRNSNLSSYFSSQTDKSQKCDLS